MENSRMKIILWIGGIAIVLAAGIGSWFAFSQREATVSAPTRVSSYMSGRIEEVKDGSIVVKGLAVSDDGSHKEGRVIEFTITSATILKQKASVLDRNDILSGKTFSPKTEDRPGNASDLKKDGLIFNISSNVNLFQVSQANAVEIYYDKTVTNK